MSIEVTSVIGLLDVTRRMHSGWLGPSFMCMPLKMACADASSRKRAVVRTVHIMEAIDAMFFDQYN
jgi:hypothetical protein